MSLSSPTSVGTARPPISSATFFSLSAARSATTTPLAPAAAYARATASPMPLAAPVTTQTLPFGCILEPSCFLVRAALLPVRQGADNCVFGVGACDDAQPPDAGGV